MESGCSRHLKCPHDGQRRGEGGDQLISPPALRQGRPVIEVFERHRCVGGEEADSAFPMGGKRRPLFPTPPSPSALLAHSPLSGLALWSARK